MAPLFRFIMRPSSEGEASVGITEAQAVEQGYDVVTTTHGMRGVGRAIIHGETGGTVKIGDVVDTNLKTARDNLYVCDCSVIPEAWGLPPTLTILGLGKRRIRDSAINDPGKRPGDDAQAGKLVMPATQHEVRDIIFGIELNGFVDDLSRNSGMVLSPARSWMWTEGQD